MLKVSRILSAIVVLCLVLGLLTRVPVLAASSASISSYSLPSIYSVSSVYSLKANNTAIPVVSYTGDYDYAAFSASGGSITLEITAAGQGSISSYSISPKKLILTGTASGNKLTFTISQDEYLIVQINGLKRLVIAVDPGETDKPASSGAGIFNVKAAPYNANSTGTVLTTTAVQNAINDASAYNGGIVYVPSGVYLVGNLQLKSNVKLYLEGGAVLRPSTNKSDYTINWHKDSINKDVTWWISTATGATNMKIYGRGTIDGNATALSGFANNLLVPMACSYLTVDGILFRDSASWAVTPARSNNLTFTNIKLFNRLNGSENDGIDVCESQNVTVTHSIGIGLDDPYTTKTWMQSTDISRNWPGAPETVNNVVFDGCISWTVCYGFKVGQGCLQDQTGVTFKNGVVYGCAVGIGIHHKYGTGTVSNTTFENIDIEKISYSNDGRRTWMAFLVQDGSSLGSGPINNTNVRNITVRDRGTTAAMVNGLSSSSSVNGVHFTNIYMLGNTVPTGSKRQLNIYDDAYNSDITVSPSTGTKIEAELFNLQSGVEMRSNCPDTGAGSAIAVGNGDYAGYYTVNCSSITKIDFRLATVNSGWIDVRLDNKDTGVLLGTLNVIPTGSWTTYTTQSVPVGNLSGTHTLYLNFRKSDTSTLCNLNWVDVHWCHADAL